MWVLMDLGMAANLEVASGIEEPAIGIDLGITYSCIGVWQYDHVEIFVNNQSNRTTLSYVAFTNTEHLIGDATKNQLIHLVANNEAVGGGEGVASRGVEGVGQSSLY
ncbi:hypothetical protein ACSBR1_030100 [Camellia fascicularis]